MTPELRRLRVASTLDIAPMEPDAHDQPPFARTSSLGYQVNLLARTMAAALSERIRPHGVVPGQFAQLLALYERDGRSVTDLANEVSIEHPTMSRTLSRMERDGLVETRADADDGRSRKVFLTERARELEPTLKAEATAVNEAFLSDLTSDERVLLIGILHRVIVSADRSR